MFPIPSFIKVQLARLIAFIQGFDGFYFPRILIAKDEISLVGVAIVDAPFLKAQLAACVFGCHVGFLIPDIR